MKTPTRTLAAAALMTASFGISAATTTTWDFTTGDTSFAYANMWNYTNSDGRTVTLRAFYADNLTNTGCGTAGCASSATAMNDSVISTSLRDATQAATIKFKNSSAVEAGIGSYGSSGVGVSNPFDQPSTSGQENSSGAQHAVDNYDYNNSAGVYNSSGTHGHDFLLFDFQTVMTPTDFRIGFKQFNNTDIDFLVAPSTLTTGFSLEGQTVAGLLANGWTKVSFNDVKDCVPGQTGCPTDFNTTAQTRYLVATGQLGGNDDAFKFAQITMNVPGGGHLPLPGSFALFAIGAAGLAVARRRRQSA